jgi:hypothetical protein
MNMGWRSRNRSETSEVCGDLEKIRCQPPDYKFILLYLNSIYRVPQAQLKELWPWRVQILCNWRALPASQDIPLWLRMVARDRRLPDDWRVGRCSQRYRQCLSLKADTLRELFNVIGRGTER